MRHVEIARTTSPRADIERRVTGRFYTPEAIASRVAAGAVALCDAAEVVCDPFCGDGRLVVAWLRAATAPRRLRRVVLWDCDAAAVGAARASVEAELARMRLDVVVVAEACDTFARARDHEASADVVVTNPPWELLKPDARDAVAGATYVRELRAYAATLARDFSGASSAKGKAMTGYGVNLARAGAIAAASLVRPGGALSLVLPASPFADQASSPFRRAFFARTDVKRIEAFPAEARLFDAVDQPFVVVAARVGAATSRATLDRFDATGERVDRRTLAIADGAPIALTLDAAQDRIVADLARDHPPLSALEGDARFGLWLGRELDETRIAEAFTSGIGVPFLKGRHVFPFRVVRDAVARIDPARRAIPSTVQKERLAWRDVSRPSQRRRMHVALVPRGDVTGNSLGVAYFGAPAPGALHALIAVMSSLAFEVQVRARLATAHVSQGVLRACAVPMRAFEHAATRARVVALVRARLASVEESPALEVAVARALGIDRESFASLLGAFPKVSADDRAALLAPALWRRITPAS